MKAIVNATRPQEIIPLTSEELYFILSKSISQWLWIPTEDNENEEDK